MDVAVVQDQLTGQLVQRLEESKYLHIPLMNRIEGRLRSKEQLEQYTGVLVHKLEERKFQDEWLVDRIDRILDLHRRLEQHEAALESARSS
jgi:hypothetical protein